MPTVYPGNSYINSCRTQERNITVNRMDNTVKDIYKELGKSEVLGPILEANIKEQLNIGDAQGQLLIQSSKGEILKQIYWYGNDSDICSTTVLYDNKAFQAYIKMTPKLKEDITDLFEQL